MMTGYKVFTSALRPPVQGGEPVWSGETPFTLPEVRLDRSRAECSYGYNFCADLHTALRIAGLWPDGYPSRVFAVEAEDAITRGDKCRAGVLTILRELPEAEVAAGVRRLSEPFGAHAERIAAEQMAWRAALARPEWDAAAVRDGLHAALAKRGLNWQVKQYDTAWDAWAARAAWAALTIYYAAQSGWVDLDPDLLTAGLREAYASGLAIAVPTAPDTLGFALVERREAKGHE
jgi:hypothetical protein